MFATLKALKKRVAEGQTDVNMLERQAIEHLRGRGWKVDYVSLRRQRDLLTPTTNEIAAHEPMVVLAAAKLGNTRLIDNLEIQADNL